MISRELKFPDYKTEKKSRDNRILRTAISKFSAFRECGKNSRNRDIQFSQKFIPARYIYGKSFEK